MRASVFVTASLLALACADQPAQESPPAAGSVNHAEASQSPASGQLEPAPASPVELAPAPQVEAASAPEPASPEPSHEQPEHEQPELAGSKPASAPSEAVDPLAPILPSVPEPGSPEADAELAELLEESTITQAEFDAAFRGSKPKLDGDQFVFGPGERTRKRPVVSIGTPKSDSSKLAASELTALALAHMRGFEGCLAVALTDDPSTKASVTLRVSFDAAGESRDPTIEGGAALGEPLRKCLVAVADNWRLAEAAGATVTVPLRLSAE